MDSPLAPFTSKFCIKPIRLKFHVRRSSTIWQEGDTQKIHLPVSGELAGKVERIESGKCSRVSVTVNPEMTVDKKGLAHGGFAFGLGG
jgi:acyl-coenzyme A thioesterase PaaI-like protein